MPSSLRTHGACMCIPDEKHQRNNSLRRSRDAEGGGGLLDALPGALEPPLVAGLRLTDVELAVGDGGGDELVLAALVAVRRPGQHGDAVVLLAVHHGGGALQHVGGGHGVGLEPALQAQQQASIIMFMFTISQPQREIDACSLRTYLGVGLAAVGLLAEQVVDLREELLGGAVLGDGLLGGGLDDDGHVAVGVEVVLVAEHLPGELPLLAGVPLGRDQQLEAVADVGDEVRVLLGLAEHVGCARAGAVHTTDDQSGRGREMAGADTVCSAVAVQQRAKGRLWFRFVTTCFPVGGGGGARLGADGRDAGE
jgi:hypothetical protein